MTNYYPDGKDGPKLTKWQSFARFLYNSDTKQFIGRTGGSWAKIIIFYIIFYLGLGIFFVIVMQLFYLTLDEKVVKWELDRSVIGTSPGIGYRPMAPQYHLGSTLIKFVHGHSGDWHSFVNDINDFMKQYENTSLVKDAPKLKTDCSFSNPPIEGKEACKFDVDANIHESCTKANTYGYEKGKPCVFLKLNRIYKWRPLYYNNASDLPEKMPPELRKTIEERERTYGNASKEMDLVWLHCEGENPADKENLGPITYKPLPGFPSYYFPYLNVPGYQSPLVSVQFDQMKYSIVINVECIAWAKNIKYSRADRRGSVHFELLVD